MTQKKKTPKYIFVVGGVISGVGKGVASSSIARILKERGFTVTALKIDPYVNVDAGTMNPTEHGEVFVLRDGDETDQDMGNYERFLDISLTRTNYMTTGRVYQTVIEKERNLEYKGKCVEVVPHVPLEVIDRIKKATTDAKADFTLVEIGGTIGEYQNILFLEALRMLKAECPGDVLTVLVSFLPIPSKLGEMKTKPTQYAVRTLNSSGIQPDIIIARSKLALDEKRKEKIAYFCSIPPANVISAPDIESIYDIPINFEKEDLSSRILRILGIPNHAKKPDYMKEWKSFAKKVHNGKGEVKIALIGKYFDSGDFVLSDSYLSVIEALKYSVYYAGKKPVLTWVNALEFEKNPKSVSKLKEFDGILVPGGFGSRGVEGKILAIKYARENKIPFFGICYGMQLAVVEYARHKAGLKGAHTPEVDKKTPYPVIDIMEYQKEYLKNNRYGGSMRLGEYPAVLKKGSIIERAYKTDLVSERHRHRYEVNPVYVEALESAGLVFAGASPTGDIMETIELPSKVHPFFVAVQYHPEFTAHPLNPHPVFSAFVKASIAKKKK